MVERNLTPLEKTVEYLRAQNKRLSRDNPPSERHFGSLQEEFEFLRAENERLWEENRARGRRLRERIEAEANDLPPGHIRDASGVHPPGWFGL